MTLREVIISERVIYYEGAVAVDGGLTPRPEIHRPNLKTLQNLTTYFSSISLENRLQQHAAALEFIIPDKSDAGEVATKLVAPQATIASGELLVRDSSFFDKIREIHDKACVAEMEAYGVIDACQTKCACVSY